MNRIFKKSAVAIIMSLGLFCACAEMSYIEIDSIQNATIIRIKSLADFESLISKNNVSTAFLQTSSGDLLINIGNTYFSFPLKNYRSIADYKAGEGAGYKNGNEYYEAAKLELPSSELYNYYKKNSFASTEDCIDANINGFPTSNEYYAAKQQGYEKYSDYKDYLTWTGYGFKGKEDWLLSAETGFGNNASRFYDAQNKGFENSSDYDKAKELGFATNEDFQIYNTVKKDLEKIADAKACERNHAVIYYFMQKLPKDEFSLGVLSKDLSNLYNGIGQSARKTIGIYMREGESGTSSSSGQRASGGYGHRGYSNSPSDFNANYFFEEEPLRNFFTKVDVKELGSYSSKSEIFKRKKDK